MAGTRYFQYGDDAPAGRYMCVDCFYVYTNKSFSPLLACPKYCRSSHFKKLWRILYCDLASTSPADDPAVEDKK